jgi:hypothetical protein
MKLLQISVWFAIVAAMTLCPCSAQEQELIGQLRRPETSLLHAQPILRNAVEIHSIAVVTAALDCDDPDIWAAAVNAAATFPREQQAAFARAALANAHVWREQKGGEMRAIQNAFGKKLLVMIRAILKNESFNANLMHPQERVTVAAVLSNAHSQ